MPKAWVRAQKTRGGGYGGPPPEIFLKFRMQEKPTIQKLANKAEILNNQFASAFTREDCSTMPSMGKSLDTEAPPLTIQNNGVKKTLEGLNPHKASGPGEISSRFLKEMAPSISPALTLICQASYDQGTVPTDWKGAYVTPLFKKGDKSKASNYRPVSLTSICSKAMEYIIHSHLMKYLDSHHILSDQQHGFRKRRSCESQLITTFHDLASGLDETTNRRHPTGLQQGVWQGGPSTPCHQAPPLRAP